MCIRDRFRVRPRLANAPYLRLMSMAVEVHTAWASAPKERPGAIGRPMWVSVMVLKPRIPPSKPTPVSYTHLDVYKRQVLASMVGYFILRPRMK